MGDITACAPADIPDRYKADIEKISTDARFQYDAVSIPYAIQAKMAEQRYVNLDDIAYRWEMSTIRTSIPEDLDLKDLQYSKNDIAFFTTRLMILIMKAKDITQTNRNFQSSAGGLTAPLQGIPTMSNSAQSLQLFEKSQRTKLFNAWKIHTSAPAPKLHDIGSTEMVRKMWSALEGGEFAHIDIKHIVPAQSETNEQPFQKNNWIENQFGSFVKTTEESTRFPQDQRAWEKKLLIYRNTLLMVIWNLPQVKGLHLEKEDLDKFYEFILGREFAGRSPTPQLSTLVYAERNSWKEINLLLREGMTAKEALVACVGKSLFWLAALTCPPPQGNNPSAGNQNQSFQGKFTRGMRRTKNKETWKKAWNTSTNHPNWQKGKGGYNKSGQQGGDYGYGGYYKGGHNKGAGKSGYYNTKGNKGGKPSKGKNGKIKNGKDKGAKNWQKKGGKNWPSHWANMDKQGREFCRNFHIQGGCNTTNCPRSHKCPKQNQEGTYICLQDHKADDCTQFM